VPEVCAPRPAGSWIFSLGKLNRRGPRLSARFETGPERKMWVMLSWSLFRAGSVVIERSLAGGGSTTLDAKPYYGRVVPAQFTYPTSVKNLWSVFRGVLWNRSCSQQDNHKRWIIARSRTRVGGRAVREVSAIANNKLPHAKPGPKRCRRGARRPLIET